MIPADVSFNDIFVTWLQGQVNSCVAGHAARIERLEETNARLSQLLEDQRDAFKALHAQVQNKVIENFDANELMEKIRESDDLDELINDVLSSSGFASAVQEEVFDRQFTEAIKDCINDLRFEVTVR